MPKPLARLATSLPMRPKPTIPIVAPVTPGRGAGWAPGEPFALADVVDALDDPASRRHQEGEGEIGRRLGEDPGGVADRHAPLGRGRNVDVVETDREVADDLELRLLIEDGAIDMIGQQGQGPDTAVDQLRQLVGAGRQSSSGQTRRSAASRNSAMPASGISRVTATNGRDARSASPA